SAVRVGNRQRVAVAPVTGAKLPFEVSSSHLIGCDRSDQRTTGVTPMAVTPTSFDQSVAIEQLASGAHRRQAQIGTLILEVVQDLAWPPQGVTHLGSKNRRFDLDRCPMRAALRGSAPVFQPYPALCLRSVQPLVAGRPADTESIAQFAHRPRSA